MIFIKNDLIQKIQNKKAVVGIVGLGYVGLPLLLSCCEAGYNAIGFDVSEEKLTALSSGKSYIEYIHNDVILSYLPGSSTHKNSGTFQVTSDFYKASEADILILCLPTPLNKYREPDLHYVTDTVDTLLPYLRSGQMFCLVSTTYPGTTEEELAPRIESRGLKIGEDIFLIFSPEREDPANPDFRMENIPKVCGGYSSACLEVGVSFLSNIVAQVVPVSSTRVAEFTKLLENIHRAVNIGLVNEMKIVADKMDIDIQEVIQAAATKPFGFVAYQPGPGLGGHCIPIDPFYLTWKAREYGVNTKFIELAGEINSSMPDYVVTKVISALNIKQKSVFGSRILILGITYKKNVADMRESPAVIIMEKLEDLGAQIAYSDPYVSVFPPMRQHAFDLSSIELSQESLSAYDCVVLSTDHDKFDYDSLKLHAKLIIDCRGRYSKLTDSIVRA